MLSSIGATGIDVLHGAYVLPALFVSAAVIILILLATVLFKAARRPNYNGMIKGGLLLLVGALIGVLIATSWSGIDPAQRRSVEARAAELTTRALAPGSALACLDAVASAEVEAACEKTLFSTPEAVAAAVAYVDARISLLAAGAPLAERDASYRPSFERGRRAIEADRFGLVAHVLVTRGCQSAGCTDLLLLRDPARVLANMNARTFETHVAMHAAAWQGNPAADVASTAAPSGGAPVVAAVAPSPPPPVATATIGAARGAPLPSKFEYPSSASIPAVSIMNPEPTGPIGGPVEPPAQRAEPPEPRAKPAPAKRAQSPRRQTAREAQPAPPPMSVLPPPPPPPPQTSATR